MDVHFFDPIFNDGAFTEQRIEAAGVRIMELVQTGQESEASAAVRVLADSLLLAIANDLVNNPVACARDYLRLRKTALGEPTLLDEIKERMERQRRHGEE
jgi:hypothetical protein